MERRRSGGARSRGVGLAICLALATAAAGQVQSAGRLTRSSPSKMLVPSASTITVSLDIVDPKGHGPGRSTARASFVAPGSLAALADATTQPVRIEDLRKRLGIERPSELRVLLSPSAGDVELERLSLEILKGGTAVFATDPACGGCGAGYSPVEAPKGDVGGHAFELDEKAANAASAAFVDGNEVRLTVGVPAKAPASAAIYVFREGAGKPVE